MFIRIFIIFVVYIDKHIKNLKYNNNFGQNFIETFLNLAST